MMHNNTIAMKPKKILQIVTPEDRGGERVWTPHSCQVPYLQKAEGKGSVQEKQMRMTLIRRKVVMENKCKIGLTGTATGLSQQRLKKSQRTQQHWKNS
jgi:hypothetical protein